MLKKEVKAYKTDVREWNRVGDDRGEARQMTASCRSGIRVGQGVGRVESCLELGL